MGSMVVGFSSAYTSPALVSMRDRNQTAFDISEQEVSESKRMEFSQHFRRPTNFFVFTDKKEKEKKIDSQIFPFFLL
jgi:hypothetical protein